MGAGARPALTFGGMLRPTHHKENGGPAATNGSMRHASQWVVIAGSQPLDTETTARIEKRIVLC
ncbi:hypothetical protein ASD32_12150 [Rhizobium sp. Root483D2]|jgi:hypothetical protein|nr:hypothetical protein ASD32_12150 [Rhizobium sp. Root483D2]